jgi:hypothetical protein
MDITPAIVHAAKSSRPKPDLPPGAKRPPVKLAAQKKPPGKPGYKTAFVNGKWVLVPVNGGNSDPALRPRVYVTPLEK